MTAHGAGSCAGYGHSPLHCSCAQHGQRKVDPDSEAAALASAALEVDAEDAAAATELSDTSCSDCEDAERRLDAESDWRAPAEIASSSAGARVDELRRTAGS